MSSTCIFTVQVGMVAVGQKFVAWARGGARATFITTALEPPEAAARGLARLTAGVEVVVAPKPRVPAAQEAPGSQPTAISAPGAAHQPPSLHAGLAKGEGPSGTQQMQAGPQRQGSSQQQQQQPVGGARTGPPKPVRLRVLPLPPALLLPITWTTVPGQPGPAPATDGVPHTWLTTAVLVSPQDAAPSQPQPLTPGHTLAPGSLVHIKAARGPAPSLALPLIVVPCALCPPGHAMLAPPVLAALQVLPHTQIIVAPVTGEVQVLRVGGAAVAPRSVTANGPGVTGRGAGVTARGEGEVDMAVHPVVWGATAGSSSTASSTSNGGATDGPVSQQQQNAGAVTLPPTAVAAVAVLAEHHSPPLSPQEGVAGVTAVRQFDHALLLWWVTQARAVTALLRSAANGSSSFPASVPLRLHSGSLVHLQLPTAATSVEAQGTAHMLPDACLVLVVKAPVRAGTTAATAPPSAGQAPCVDFGDLDLLQQAVTAVSPPLRAHLASSPIQLPPLPAYPSQGKAGVAGGSAAVAAAETSTQSSRPGSQSATAVTVAPWGTVTAVTAQAAAAAVQSVSWLSSHLSTAVQRVTAGAVLPPLAYLGQHHHTSAAFPHVSVTAGRILPPPPPSGHVLISGPAGSGRSALMRAAAHLLSAHPSFQLHVVGVRCAEIASVAPGSQGGARAARAALEAALAEAVEYAPSLLLLDDLDMLAPSSQVTLTLFRFDFVRGSAAPPEHAALLVFSWVCVSCMRVLLCHAFVVHATVQISPVIMHIHEPRQC